MTRALERIALLNFGGLGDEILFSPVVQTVRQACPQSQLELICESRSARIKDLMPELDGTVEVYLQYMSRPALFLRLLSILRSRHYDAVISSGSSPMIALLLFLSGIPIRVGFDTGRMSRLLLTATASLVRETYAADMLFSLARAFLKGVGSTLNLPHKVIPQLSISPLIQERALQLIQANIPEQSAQRILIHPGVSQMSIAKNILKSWPLESWQQLLQLLPQQYPGAQVLLLGGPEDHDTMDQLEAYRLSLPLKHQHRILNLYGQTVSFIELAGLIAIGDILISVDSAPMHLAVALGTPVVAIFAPTDPQKLLPISDKAKAVFREDLSCRPCLFDQRQTSCEKPECLQVGVQEVLKEVTGILQGTPSAC